MFSTIPKFQYDTSSIVIPLTVWPQKIVETSQFLSLQLCQAYPYFCQTTVYILELCKQWTEFVLVWYRLLLTKYQIISTPSFTCQVICEPNCIAVVHRGTPLDESNFSFSPINFELIKQCFHPLLGFLPISSWLVHAMESHCFFRNSSLTSQALVILSKYQVEIKTVIWSGEEMTGQGDYFYQPRSSWD